MTQEIRNTSLLSRNLDRIHNITKSVYYFNFYFLTVIMIVSISLRYQPPCPPLGLGLASRKMPQSTTKQSAGWPRSQGRTVFLRGCLLLGGCISWQLTHFLFISEMCSLIFGQYTVSLANDFLFPVPLWPACSWVRMLSCVASGIITCFPLITSYNENNDWVYDYISWSTHSPCLSDLYSEPSLSVINRHFWHSIGLAIRTIWKLCQLLLERIDLFME